MPEPSFSNYSILQKYYKKQEAQLDTMVHSLKVVSRLWKNCEKVVRKLCKRCEKVVRKLRASCEKVVRKLWENCEIFVIKLWESWEKFVRNLWENCERVVKKLGESCEKVLRNLWENCEKIVRELWKSWEKAVRKFWESLLFYSSFILCSHVCSFLFTPNLPEFRCLPEETRGHGCAFQAKGYGKKCLNKFGFTEDPLPRAP